MEKLKFSLFALISLLVLASCKPELVDPDPPTTPTGDSIVYTAITPPIQLYSVDSFYSHPSGCGLYPANDSGSASHTLDFNQDGQSELTLLFLHEENWVSASDPCVNFNYEGRATATDSSLTFMVAPDAGYFPIVALDSGEVVQPVNSFLNLGYFHFSRPAGPFFTSLGAKGYVGFQWIPGNQQYFGWLEMSKEARGVTLHGYAINYRSGNDISAGQIQ